MVLKIHINNNEHKYKTNYWIIENVHSWRNIHDITNQVAFLICAVFLKPNRVATKYYINVLRYEYTP